MADIINLNRFRKARSRAEDEKRAADNRVAFGRTKAEKAQSAAEKALTEKRQDGLRLIPSTPDTDRPE